MNILFAASEMVPFCKTGGLADVIGALPPVLAARGNRITVLLPGYSIIDRERWGFKPVPFHADIAVGDVFMPLSLSAVEMQGMTVMLLEHGCWHRDSLYGNQYGDYADNGVRFIFFARGVLEVIQQLNLSPDILHCHDWQAGLVPPYLSFEYGDHPSLSDTASLMTVHNLGYQGVFPPEIYGRTGLPWSDFTWEKMEYWGKFSFLKAGLIHADALSTVSKTYAREITTAEFGHGLDGVMYHRRAALHGIVNGIDTVTWDPATDPGLPSRYDLSDMSGKKACRSHLLDTVGMNANPSEPVVGMVTRLDDQKGLDIIEEAMDDIAGSGARVIILGTGAAHHHAAMQELSGRYPDTVRAILRFDNDMARLIYAGSDAFLMPSKYEPCGLSQLIAMRYGTLPIVRATGGLSDTVRDIDEDRMSGTGFVFHEYSARALADTVRRAVETWRAPGRQRWRAAMRRAMAGDYSWDAAAEQYESLYRQIRQLKSASRRVN